MLWRATVQREDPSKPHFSPNPQQAQSGDAVFWFNEDKDTSHQLYPTAPVQDPPLAPGAWGDPIGPGTPSEQVNLPNAGSITYKCAVKGHEDESGTIVVANACIIAAGVVITATTPFFRSLTVNNGECVSWGNADERPHQPTPDTGEPWFKEPIQSGDLSASIPFNVPAGTSTDTNVTYHCSLHSDEKGTVTVTAPNPPKG